MSVNPYRPDRKYFESGIAVELGAIPLIAPAVSSNTVTLQSIAGYNSPDSSTTVFTQSITVSAGTDLALAIGVTLESDGSDGRSVISATFNGDPLTLVDAQSSGSWGRSEIWGMVAPDVGTHDLVVTVNGPDRLMIGAIVAENVDQTTPFLTAAKSTGTATTCSNTVSGVATGDLVFDVLSLDGGPHTPYTIGADQTSGWEVISAAEVDSTGSYQSGADAGVMSWTWTSSCLYAHVATAFKASASGGGSDSELQPTGISSTAAIGTHTVSPGAVTVAPNGIAPTYAIGTHTVTPGAVTVAPNGISSTAAIGTHTVTPGAVTVAPDGISSIAAIGTHTVAPGAVTVAPNGIAPTAAIGTHTVAVNITATSISSTAAIGIPTVVPGAVTVAPNGIAPTDAIGTHTVAPGAVTVAPNGIASTDAIGTHTVAPGVVTVAPNGIAPTDAIGTHTVVPGTVTVAPNGIATTLTLGSPTVAISIAAVGIETTVGIGIPKIDLNIVATGIANTNVFGLGTIDVTTVINPDGIPSIAALGSPTITPGEVAISPTGIPSTEAFGNLDIFSQQVIEPSGIASTILFGSPTLSQYLSISPVGIRSTLQFGSFEAFYIPKPDFPPIKVEEAVFSDSILKLTIKEVYRGRPFFDLLQKLANHVIVEVVEDSIPGVVKVTRDGFLAEMSSEYLLKETGSGVLVGMFKNVHGVLKPISPGISNEIRILVGQKGVEMVPPKGWEIISDVDIQNRYNVGIGPNWVTAAIRYIGI